MLIDAAKDAPRTDRFAFFAGSCIPRAYKNGCRDGRHFV
jgi:hypothetical protein